MRLSKSDKYCLVVIQVIVRLCEDVITGRSLCPDSQSAECAGGGVSPRPARAPDDLGSSGT